MRLQNLLELFEFTRYPVVAVFMLILAIGLGIILLRAHERRRRRTQYQLVLPDQTWAQQFADAPTLTTAAHRRQRGFAAWLGTQRQKARGHVRRMGRPRAATVLPADVRRRERMEAVRRARAEGPDRRTRAFRRLMQAMDQLPERQRAGHLPDDLTP